MSVAIETASFETAGFLQAAGVIPVVVVADADQAVRLADALHAGGLPGMEVTFRSAAAASAIAAVASIDAAVDAGAHFGVAPGTAPVVVRRAIDRGLAFIPGVATATELELASGLGMDLFKLFPAEVVGGVKLIDALAGPYANARFMPTGGIREADLGRYLSCASVLACGGTWIAPSELLDAGDYAEISRRAASAASVVRTIREVSRKEHQHGA